MASRLISGCSLDLTRMRTAPHCFSVQKRDVRAMYSLPKHFKLPFEQSFTTDPDSDAYDSDDDDVALPLSFPTSATILGEPTLPSPRPPSHYSPLSPLLPSTSTEISNVDHVELHPASSSNGPKIQHQSPKPIITLLSSWKSDPLGAAYRQANLARPGFLPQNPIIVTPIIVHALPASSSNESEIQHQAPKHRKPYVCSEKHSAHNCSQKEAASAKLKQWQNDHKLKSKHCYVCNKTKSMSEFYRVRNHGHDCASGRCVACKNSPSYPEAYKKMCENRGWTSNFDKI